MNSPVRAGEVRPDARDDDRDEPVSAVVALEFISFDPLETLEPPVELSALLTTPHGDVHCAVTYVFPVAKIVDDVTTLVLGVFDRQVDAVRCRHGEADEEGGQHRHRSHLAVLPVVYICPV